MSRLPNHRLSLVACPSEESLETGTARMHRPASLTMDDDNRFVESCQSSDAAAWNELIGSHSRRIYRMCFRFTRRECEALDMTQEVFLRVYRTLGSFRVEERSFVAWLNLLTLNLLRDNYRRSRRERGTVSLGGEFALIKRLPVASGGPDLVYEGTEARRILHSALARLAPRYREIILLHDVHELKYREIALRLGVPVGTVKSRLNGARTALARCLRRYRRTAEVDEAGNDKERKC